MVSRMIVALGGFMCGAALAPMLLIQIRPEALIAPPVAHTTPDVTLSISRDLFAREANRRLGPTLNQYRLKSPDWELGDDNTITLTATSTLPVLDLDVHLRVISQPVVRDGALAIDVHSIEYGRVIFGGDPFKGLADDVNKQLATAVDRRRFEVEGVQTDVNSLTLQLRVAGNL